MNIKVTIEGNKATLSLQGRMDTAATNGMMAEIDSRLAGKDIKSLTLDASLLEYISSSGLRIMLSLAKRFKDFRIVEASADVYQVLEMTGFTQIMSVDKALRRMSVDGCDIIGVGGVGTVYRLDDDTIIKVFRPGTTIGEVRKEITMSKEAFVKGMPTAISFDVVRVGNQYGLVYELLRADTLSACVMKEPQRIDHFAQLYASLFTQMHAIEVAPGDSIFQDVKQRIKEDVERISRYFDPEAISLMKSIADAIPDGNRLLHCDLQSKNAMLQGDELMLIDMGEVAYGHPVVDMAHSYSPMMSLIGSYEAITGLTQQLANDLWMRMADYYFQDLPADMKAHRIEQVKVVSRLRNVTWLALSDSFPEEIIQQCRKCFDERVTEQREFVMEVCDTLADWQLT